MMMTTNPTAEQMAEVLQFAANSLKEYNQIFADQKPDEHFAKWVFFNVTLGEIDDARESKEKRVEIMRRYKER